MLSALGLPVPTPYYLHAFLFGPYTESPDDKVNLVNMTRILMSVEISERDLSFYEDVMEGYTDWWKSSLVRFPTYDELTDIVQRKFTKVFSL